MSYGIEKHLDNLLRHIKLVQQATELLGRNLIDQGQVELGRDLIAVGLRHDASKFGPLEWTYLHIGSDVPSAKLKIAVQQHHAHNPHHPEYWDQGINEMPDLYLAEMVCDWYARAQEFGTGLIEWIQEVAFPRFRPDSATRSRIEEFLEVLLEDSFSPILTRSLQQ